MSCPDCFKGAVHSGTILGKEVKLHGLDTYLITPPDGTPTKGIIVFIPDAFGWRFGNNRLLADNYAKAGYRVIMPEFMDGRAAPLYVLDYLPLIMDTSVGLHWLWKPYYLAWTIAGFAPFLIYNNISRSTPRVVSYFQEIYNNPTPEEKDLPVFATGFCWGGKHVVQLTYPDWEKKPGDKKGPLITAGYTAHPSFVNAPADLEKVSAPLSIAVGTKDMAFGEKAIEAAKEVLEKKKDIGEVVVYDGAEHGFAVRAQLEYPKLQEHAKQAEEQAIAWFDKYLPSKK